MQYCDNASERMPLTACQRLSLFGNTPLSGSSQHSNHFRLCLCREKKDDFDLSKHRQRMQTLDMERQREAGCFNEASFKNAVAVK